MSDLISRQAALDVLKRLARGQFNLSDEYIHYLAGLLDAEIEIKNLPTEEPRCYLGSPCEYQNAEIRLPTVEPKTGRWKPYPIADGCIQCSVCGILRVGEPSNYCPNCGAKMDKSLQWEEPEINPCRGCEDYDGQGGCLSNGGCAPNREG